MSLIKNKEELLDENRELRSIALEILEAGLSAIDTEKIIKEKIKIKEGHIFCINESCLDLNFYERIFFIGVGKCAFDGARLIEEILGKYLTDGMVIDVKGGALKKIRSRVGTHPYPSQPNCEFSEEVMDMVKDVTEKDLIIVLVSGGGSSLFCLPNDLNCQNLVDITKELTQKGADIFEMNTVRKHLSKVQGGGLAKICFPAHTVSLIFSDVANNDMGVIASGPTVLDESTALDAEKIIKKYEIAMPKSGSETIQFIETPKDPKYFRNIYNCLICSNKDALLAMKSKAEDLGFDAEIESKSVSGVASALGKIFASRDYPPKSCFLSGGETTVLIKDKSGVGGRNQEVGLSALSHLKQDSVLVATSSDGFDNTEHAGVLVDSFLFEKSKSLGVSPHEYLERNDSFNFFKKVGGAISTGRLGSNVSDLFIIITK